VKIAATGPIGEDIGPTSSHVLGRVVGLIFHPVAFHVDFFFSCSLIFQKMMWKKYWVHLTSIRSLKVKNVQKQENPFHGVISK
jgi:hypothetical protein